MAVRARRRNELAAALERGEVPAPRRTDAMFVGNIKLASAKGHLTKAGYAWIKMGGVDPVRYSGELIVDGESKYVRHGQGPSSGPPQTPPDSQRSGVAPDQEGVSALSGAQPMGGHDPGHRACEGQERQVSKL